MPFAYDPINQKFVFFSPVTSTEPLSRKQIAEHVDHAIIALDGRAPLAGDCCLEPMSTVAGPTTLRVDLWVKEMESFACTYAFLVSTEDGVTPIARGERTVVNVDPHSYAPRPWDDDFRAAHQPLQKDLFAYA